MSYLEFYLFKEDCHGLLRTPYGASGLAMTNRGGFTVGLFEKTKPIFERSKIT